MKDILCLFFLSGAAAEDLLNRKINGIWLLMLAVTGTAGIAERAGDPPAALAAFVPGAFILLLSLLSDGKIGEGDAYCLLALACGRELSDILEILLMGSCGAGTYSLFLILRKGREAADERFAFIPFLTAAFAAHRILLSLQP